MRLLILVIAFSVAVIAEPNKKRQNVPNVVLNAPAGGQNLPTQKRKVLHIPFTKSQGNVILDTSGYANNGYMMAGTILVNFPKSACGNAAYTYCGDILFHGDTFQAKPRDGVTIAAWLNLKDVAGSHSIFDTIGISHGCGQYHFEANNGAVRWFHRNETQHTVFSTTAEGAQVPKDTWTHVAGTYDAASGKAKVYINGELRNMTTGAGLLSRDWLTRAGIGDHKAARPLRGYIDDFQMYNYAMTKAELAKVIATCKLLPPPPKKKPSADLGSDWTDTSTMTPVVQQPAKEQQRDGEITELDNSLHHSTENVEEAVLKRDHVTKTIA